MEFLRFLESIRTDFGDWLISLITRLGEETVFLMIGLLFLWCIDKKRGYYILVAGFIGTVINQFLKIVCCVPRPWELDPSFTIVESARAEATGYSFPSGHTQISTSLYGCIARTEKKHRWMRIVMPALILSVAFSRMYLGVHTPKDVLVSLLIGSALIFGLYPIMMREHKSPWVMYGTLIGTFSVTLAFFLFVNLYSFSPDVDPVNLQSAVENASKLFGTVFAIVIIYIVDVKWLRYPTHAIWWAQLIKLVGGLGMIILVKSLFKSPLNALLGLSLGNATRYFILVLIAGLVWPLTFRFFARLGQKTQKNAVED